MHNVIESITVDRNDKEHIRLLNIHKKHYESHMEFKAGGTMTVYQVLKFRRADLKVWSGLPPLQENILDTPTLY